MSVRRTFSLSKINSKIGSQVGVAFITCTSHLNDPRSTLGFTRERRFVDLSATPRFFLGNSANYIQRWSW